MNQLLESNLIYLIHCRLHFGVFDKVLELLHIDNIADANAPTATSQQDNQNNYHAW